MILARQHKKYKKMNKTEQSAIDVNTISIEMPIHEEEEKDKLPPSDDDHIQMNKLIQDLSENRFSPSKEN